MLDLDKLKGMIVDGVAGSEAIDSSGEILDVGGADISDFKNGVAVINYEHKNPEDPGNSALDIVGRIVYAKKIFKLDDCDTSRQKEFWEKVKLPYIYFIGILADEAGHIGAQAAAALIRNDIANGFLPLCRWSVEGSTLEQKDHRLVRTVCRRLALTLKPCNRSVLTGILADPAAPKGYEAQPEKVDKPTGDLLEQLAERFAEKMTLKSERPAEEELMYKKLGSSWEDSYDPVIKALSAGIPGGAPGTLTGGAALQREDLSERATKLHEQSNKAKGALRDWWGGESQKGTPLRSFLKMKLPEASPEFLERFASAVDDYRLKGVGKGQMLKSEDQPLLQKKAARQLEAPEPGDAQDEGGGDDSFDTGKLDRQAKKTLIVPQKYQQLHAKLQGPAPSPKTRAGAYFDPAAGILHTHLGSYPMQIPKDAGYHAILHSPEVQKPHEEAMRNWIQLHKILKSGKLPQEVAMHAALFSGQSPASPVPLQEIGYSHLQDLMQHGGMNPMKPGGVNSRHRKEYLNAVLPGTAHLPEYMNEHWKGPAGDATRDEQGNQKGSLYPQQKWYSVQHYSELHPDLVKLLSQHKDDGATIAYQLMQQKREGKKHDMRAKTAEKKGKGDQPRYEEATGNSQVRGFAPKTIRYMLGMMGAGNLHVPDTHFIRHAFNLPSDHQVHDEAEQELGRPLDYDKEQVYSPNEHLKNVLWYGPNAHNIGAAMDKFYGENHPAVQMVREKYGKDIDPQQAIFPGFWAHWLSIAPHEASQQGRMRKVSHNAATNHEVYWNAVRNILQHYGLEGKLKKEEVGLADAGKAHPGILALPLHVKTALAQKAMQRMMGETPASLFYAQKLLPLLLQASKGRNAEAQGPAAVRKAENMAIELQRFTSLLKAQQEDEAAGLREFQGQKVVPGRAAVNQGGQNRHLVLLGGTRTHHIGHFQDDPQQKLVRIPKDSKSIVVAQRPQLQGAHVTLDTNEHSIPEVTHHPEQKALIHGLNLGPGPEVMPRGAERDMDSGGMNYGRSQWSKGPGGQPVFVKGSSREDAPGSWAGTTMGPMDPMFTEARREAAYYNIGKEFFGLGDYLTPTAAFQHPLTGSEHAVVQGIPDAQHFEGHYEQKQTLRKLHDAGELDKIFLMNRIMGNRDRNDHNYLHSPSSRGGIKLIDHGLSFEPMSRPTLPSYMRNVGSVGAVDTIPPYAHPVHPIAQEWLQHLDPLEFMRHLNANAVPEKERGEAYERLMAIKGALRLNPNLDRMGVMKSHSQFEPAYQPRPPRPQSDVSPAPPFVRP